MDCGLWIVDGEWWSSHLTDRSNITFRSSADRPLYSITISVADRDRNSISNRGDNRNRISVSASEHFSAERSVTVSASRH